MFKKMGDPQGTAGQFRREEDPPGQEIHKRPPAMPKAPPDAVKQLQKQLDEGRPPAVKPKPEPTPAGPVSAAPRGATQAVVAAVYLWAAEYHASGLGMVDWYCQLDESRRQFASRVVRAILDAPA